MFNHILVPTDGGTRSKLAVERAITFAKESTAKVTFFYAKPDYPMAFYGEGALIDPTSPDQFAQMADNRAKEILDSCLADAAAAGIVADAKSTVNDVPWEAIVAAADEVGADMIFMASHGRRGIAGFLLGSETQRVLIHSKVPVLVYR